MVSRHVEHPHAPLPSLGPIGPGVNRVKSSLQKSTVVLSIFQYASEFLERVTTGERN
jgi:hypothetical protein